MYKYKNILTHYFLGWLIASLAWQLLRNTDLSNPDYAISYRILEFLFLFLFQGFLYGSLHFIVDKYLNRRIRFIRLLVSSLTLQLLIAFIIIYLFYFIFSNYNFIQSENSFMGFLKHPSIITAFLYAIIVNFLITLSLEINIILGKRTLFNIVQGKYHFPKVEQKIFMFIDLQGSTTIAEELGTLQFTNLIQDCFYDLKIINKYKAEVYKYVGDEVILVWTVKNGVTDLNCVNTFFEYINYLTERQNYYNKNYFCTPIFKAGIHLGECSIAEIGELKREIAYLGDTVNTAARIQGQCNEYGTNLLISEALLNELDLKNDIKVKKEGKIQLKGKKEFVNIFSLTK